MNFEKILFFIELVKEDPNLLIDIIKKKPVSISSYKNVKNIKNIGLSPNLIIDVGANIGQFAYMSRYYFPEAKIICFEPSNKNYSILEQNLKGYYNIELNKIGLGDKNGIFEFYNYNFDQISSFIKINESNKNPNYANSSYKLEKIEIKTLDDFLREETEYTTILLKLDVQGYEEKVLLGSKKSLKKIKYILLEIAFEQLYENQKIFHEMYELLVELGYSILAPVGFNRGKNNKIIEADFLFEKKND